MRKIAFAIMLLAAVALLKITELKQSKPVALAELTPVAIQAPVEAPAALPTTEVKPVVTKVKKTPKVVEQKISIAQAAPSSPSNLLSLDILTENIKFGRGEFAGQLATGYSSNLYESSSSENKSSTTYQAVLDYKINKGPNTIRGLFAGYKELTQGEENKLKDGYVAWLNNEIYFKGKMASVGQHVRLVVPMSDESVKRDERITGVVLAPIATLDLTPVGLIGVTLTYQPRLTKNFHKYNINRADATNNEYSLSQLGSIKWAMTDHWYWQNDLLYTSFWSYGGVKKNDNYDFTSEIGYAFTNGLGLAGGINNAGAMTNVEQGEDKNIKFFDKETASVYSELSYSF